MCSREAAQRRNYQRRRAEQNTMKNAMTAVLASAVLAGCASRGEKFRPEAVAGDQAAIYVYRTGGGWGSVRVVIDQQDAADLRSGEYIVRIVKPGEHLVRAEGSSIMARTASLVPGDAAYFEVSKGMGGLALNVPEESVARRKIAGSSKVP